MDPLSSENKLQLISINEGPFDAISPNGTRHPSTHHVIGNFVQAENAIKAGQEAGFEIKEVTNDIGEPSLNHLRSFIAVKR